MLPNFLICGAAKCGTTSLYEYLRSHSDIFMPLAKELDFFSNKNTMTLSEYENQFYGWKGEKAVGEASPSYMACSDAPKAIAEVIPDVKLIFLLRNPIERAYSAYWYYIWLGGMNSDRTFSEIIRVKGPDDFYLEEGFYYKYIKRFREYFERDQIHCVITEELKGYPLEEVSKCFRFLGVDDSYRPDVKKQHKAGQYPRNIYMFVQLSRLWHRYKKSLASFSFITDNLKKRIKWKLFTEKNTPSMKKEDRAYLREIYKEQNRLLSEFLGKDLSFWS